ncbi:MAG TPA: bifunctional adenosylcobinamide kinase/adenosylcobinamide-phosphate guanylyltransferase [Nocardioidaceae bacterium]|nr:bifunctional adenosylcobinamide kinase/adenosylcobinamide-phosphate guanylyltransferase [Nocardioidaceae bacterium]
MELVVLGTAAADGWPNPFCACASCRAMRSSGRVRAQTSVLLDGRLLIDCGADAPRSAARAGRSLAGVTHVLLTHAHPDHCDPAFLLYRSWVTEAPVTVLGPPPVIAACRDWVAPDSPVRLRPIAPGQHVDCGGYGVTAVPATHLGEGAALLYDVTGPDGSRLLYATDTGPLRAAAVRAVTDAAYDVVLLEETFGAAAVPRGDHLNFASFGETLDELRAAGAVTAATDVIAVHLSHANPPEPQLADRLAGYGARLVDDGAVMPVEPAGQAPVTRTLVLGGARSGKSRRSEVLLRSEPEVVYVATAKAMPGDAEWDRRVAAHRARRPASWRTVETTDLEGLLAEPGAPLLVDCLTLWLNAVMDECSAWDDDRWADDAEQRVAERVDALAAAVRGSRRTLVMVSNEVGSGVVPATASGRRFRDALGRLNTVVAQSSDRVLLCVAGRSLELEP